MHGGFVDRAEKDVFVAENLQGFVEKHHPEDLPLQVSQARRKIVRDRLGTPDEALADDPLPQNAAADLPDGLKLDPLRLRQIPEIEKLAEPARLIQDLEGNIHFRLLVSALFQDKRQKLGVR